LRDGSVVFGSLDGKLYCIDSSGNKKWEYDAGAEIASTPLVQDVTIVFGTRAASGISAKIIALKMDGSHKWTINASGDVDTAPVEGSASVVYVTDAAGKLYAIQPDGTLLWRYVAGASLTAPTMCNGQVLFGSQNKYVYGIASDGRLLWKFAAGKRVRSQPRCIASGSKLQVYFGSNDHHIYSIEVA